MDSAVCIFFTLQVFCIYIIVSDFVFMGFLYVQRYVSEGLCVFPGILLWLFFLLMFCFILFFKFYHHNHLDFNEEEKEKAWIW